jgi:hypothetical protein
MIRESGNGFFRQDRAQDDNRAMAKAIAFPRSDVRRSRHETRKWKRYD